MTPPSSTNEAGGGEHAPERAVARIDLGAIERNCTRLASALTGGAELCAVVKADGYGHGAAWSAGAALAGGASWLAVVSGQEAEDLRAHHPSPRILVMGALTPSELDLALGAAADVAVWKEGFRRLVAERAERLGLRARIHVKFDSGMGRLGERDPDVVMELVRACLADERIELAGFWTHFATADDRSSDFFDEQLERFSGLAAQVKEAHPGCIVHAANSAALLRDAAAHFDMARCGISIYGLDPFGEDPFAQELEPALALESYLADVKRFPAGASAGYGRRWRARRETWVGVVPIGYGDGVRRGLSDNGEVLAGGRRRPIVGTVSMDNITIDLGPDTDLEPGDSVVVIGEQRGERILAEEVARRLDTINYEVTCAVAPRVRRAYTR